MLYNPQRTKLKLHTLERRSRVAMAGELVPIIAKTYCLPSQVVLMVRKRPAVTNGGGFAVLNGRHEVIFTVEGCGSLGAKGEMVVRDGNKSAVLFIREKDGLVQALSLQKRWNGYLMEYDGPTKLIFSLRETKPCLMKKKAIKISLEPSGYTKSWDFEVTGSFPDKSCTISDRRGNTIAQVGVMETMKSKDLYHVMVQPGYDQAFVIGVISVLDNIHGESTRC